MDMYSEPGMSRIVQETGFRYALTVGGLDGRPFYLLRGVPEDIAAHIGKTVSVLGVELAKYSLKQYAVLKCAVIEEATTLRL